MVDRVARSVLYSKTQAFEKRGKDFILPDHLLTELYDLMKWAPTSVNGIPARILFLRSRESKEKLLPAVGEDDYELMVAAPVTVIVGMEMDVHGQFSNMSSYLNVRSLFIGDPERMQIKAHRNSSLQGGYLIMASRKIGLDCVPVSDFDKAMVEGMFFSGTSTRVSCICNIGYGEHESVARTRAPRLPFSEACKIL